MAGRLRCLQKMNKGAVRDPDLFYFREGKTHESLSRCFLVVLGMTGCTSVHYNETDCGTLPSDTFWSEMSPFNVRNIEGSRQKRHIELK